MSERYMPLYGVPARDPETTWKAARDAFLRDPDMEASEFVRLLDTPDDPRLRPVKPDIWVTDRDDPPFWFYLPLVLFVVAIVVLGNAVITGQL